MFGEAVTYEKAGKNTGNYFRKRNLSRVFPLVKPYFFVYDSNSVVNIRISVTVHGSGQLQILRKEDYE